MAGGGWILGHLIDGLQAELALVPFAGTSVHELPKDLTDERVIFLVDIVLTYDTFADAARTDQPKGDTTLVAIG